jgi:uncharacterized protein
VFASRPSTPLRLLLAALAIILLGGLALTLIQLTDTALSIYERLQKLPLWIAIPLATALLSLGFALAWVIWRLLRPAATHKLKVDPEVSRQAILERAERLKAAAQNAVKNDRAAPIVQATDAIREEITALEDRRSSGILYVAFFGEISTGKSSLIRAISGQDIASEVLGGTTQQVQLVKTQLDDIQVTLADVPGTNEVQAEARAILAREEALRAHVVVLVVTGDLSRVQAEEWQWLKAFDKPMLLLLNKIDRYSAVEASQLKQALQQKFSATVIPVSAGFSESLERIAADGQVEQVHRQRPPQITDFLHALKAIARRGALALEPARERAVLKALDLKLDQAETLTRQQQAEALVQVYTRRAVAGALAAIAPASDLLIQSALAIAMSKEIAAVYDQRLRDVDADDLLKLVGGRLKGSVALVLAIAGNAAKAFPGLGTLSGGALHAIAYGLLFQSFGHALVASLSQHGRVDQAFLLQRLKSQLSDHKGVIQAVRQLAKISADEITKP